MARDFATVLSRIEAKAVNAAISAVDDATRELKSEVDANTPEDTGTLLSGNVTEAATFDGRRVEGKVSNSTEYAVYVEYGLWRPFNYHKPKGTVFKTTVGARMFTIARDKLERKIARDFLDKITKAWKA